jgi:hypothetical protein
MKIFRYLYPAFFLLIILKCTSVDNAVREKDRFSTDMTYAILPFDCPNKEIAVILSKELTDKLSDFGFKIMSRDEVNKIIATQGLKEEDLINNYILAINKLKGIDAIIIGKITLDRGISSSGLIGSGNSGGFNDYINNCEAQAVDINSGEIISRAWFKSPAQSNTSGSVTPAFIADKIARKLSPH